MSIKSASSLFVIDFNGVLLKRAKNLTEREKARNLFHIPNYESKSEDVFMRPHLVMLSEFFKSNKDFCDYAFWTSATEVNAKLLYGFVKRAGFINPKFLWNQNLCEIIGHTSVKPLFLKDLSKVWKEYETEYLKSNIILIDDDDYKSEHKENFIHIDKYDVTTEDSFNDDALKRLVKYLEKLKLDIQEKRHIDCISFIKMNSFKNFRVANTNVENNEENTQKT